MDARQVLRPAAARLVVALIPALAIAALLALPQAALANLSRKVKFDIAPQQLPAALLKYSQQSGVQVTSPGRLIEGKASPGVTGTLEVRGALDQLLKNTNLRYDIVGDNTVLIRGIGEEGATQPAAAPGEARVLSPGMSPATLRLAQVTGVAAPRDNRAEQNTRRDDEDESELVVTGSRIARPASQLAANVMVLDAEALRATGESTLEGALRELPQNILGASEVGATVQNGGMSFNGAMNLTGGSSINLRGLGSESSLVLIDGRRIGKSGSFGGISDVSGIPLSSVERVEIMLDGASAIYGSDAVGGVVNIILKKEYRGVEAAFEYGAPQEGGFDERLATLSGGRSWSNGRVRLTFEHMRRGNLDGADRPGRAPVGSNYQEPGALEGVGSVMFYRYEGQNYLPSQLAGAGLTPATPGIEAARYAQLPAGQNGIGLTVDDFSVLGDHVRQVYGDVGGGGISLIPFQERGVAQLGFDVDLFGGKLTLSGNGYYADRQTDSSSGPFIFTGRVPAGANGNPFESQVYQYWRVDSLPSRRYETDQQVMRWNIGLGGPIGKRWNWNLAAGQSRDEFDSMYYNRAISFVNARFTQLLGQGLNLFASDIEAANSPELLAQLVDTPQNAFAVNEERQAEFSVSGSLFSLPGGNVHLALGADWREELLETGSRTRVTETTGDLTGTLGSLPSGAYADTNASRRQHSAFAEVLLPVIGPGNARKGVERLNLTGAGRYDSYDQYGRSDTWSLGAVWNPVNTLTVKLNKATSFVVPTPRDQLVAGRMFDYVPSFGPAGYPFAQIVNENGALTGETVALRGTISGGNPDLEPETATSVSGGVEFAPSFAPGLKLSAVWHQTDYRNRIGPAPAIHWLSGTDFDAKYPNLSADENGLLWWDLRAINAASLEVEGIDYRVQYTTATALGELLLSANVGYTSQYDRQVLETDEPLSEVGEAEFQTRAVVPAYRYSFNAGWYRGGLSLNMNATTASKTISTGLLASTGRVQRIAEPALKMDFLASYDFEQGGIATPAWLRGATVSLRVLNLFDDYPRYTVRSFTPERPSVPEVNAHIADPRGRMFYVRLLGRF